MIDMASIRNASFSLTPTGYNPEEVDHFLVTLADTAPGSIDLSAVRNASFSLTPTGYNPEEVDHFLGSIADQLAADPAPHSEQVEPEISTPEPEPEPEPEAEVEHAA
jgi:DivIVA domain-containing protein